MVKPRDYRVPIMLSEEEVTAIDDWRFSNRVATRSEAIRKLCKISLMFDSRRKNFNKSIHDHQLTGGDFFRSFIDYVNSNGLQNDPDIAKIMFNMMKSWKALNKIYVLWWQINVSFSNFSDERTFQEAIEEDSKYIEMFDEMLKKYYAEDEINSDGEKD